MLDIYTSPLFRHLDTTSEWPFETEWRIILVDGQRVVCGLSRFPASDAKTERLELVLHLAHRMSGIPQACVEVDFSRSNSGLEDTLRVYGPLHHKSRRSESDPSQALLPVDDRA